MNEIEKRDEDKNECKENKCGKPCSPDSTCDECEECWQRMKKKKDSGMGESGRKRVGAK